MSIVSRFPAEWLTRAEVQRSGGTDPRGNPLPGSEHTVEPVLVANQSTDEEARTDLPDTSAYVLAGPGEDFAPDDVVTIPKGNPPLWPHGRFIVNGDPGFTPLGVRVQLRRI